MSTFLAELYVASAAPPPALNRVRADEGPARLLRSLVLPGDETWFLVFKARSAEEVEQLLERAGVAYERVVSVLEGGETE